MSEAMLFLAVGIPLALLVVVGCALWFGSDQDEDA